MSPEDHSVIDGAVIEIVAAAIGVRNAAHGGDGQVVLDCHFQ